MLKANLLVFSLNLLGGLVSAAPTYIGGPPPDVFGAHPTRAGPIDQGKTTFPAGTREAVGIEVALQNLLAAEWIVQGFYKQGVEYFTQSDFTEAGFPADTLERLKEIYENENGHLRIFELALPDDVTKPGQCKYDYGFKVSNSKKGDAITYMYLLTNIEIGSMGYVTGLAQSAREVDSYIGTEIVGGILSSETRHLAWANYAPLKSSPFVGPSDTAYPWPTHILSTTKQFFVLDSCPSNNPLYPIGDQLLPKFHSPLNTSSIKADGTGWLDLKWVGPQNSSNAYNPDLPPPNLAPGQTTYWGVFHQQWNYTVSAIVPANYTQTSTIRVAIPPLLSPSGELIVVLTNTSSQLQPDRPQDVIGGPVLIEMDFPDIYN